jgi:hypothetical protein
MRILVLFAALACAAEIRAEAPMWERVIRECGAKVE